MALTPSHRPTREWPLLILTLAVVGLVCVPLAQTLTGDAAALSLGPAWTAERWCRLLVGPEQVACYCCCLWACFILVSRGWEVRRQRRAFTLPLLPAPPRTRLLPEDAERYQRHLQAVTVQRGPLILVNLIRLALARFAVSRSGQQLGETVRAQAEIEQGRLVSSMALVHYLAWAIPALGFLGTVRGLAGSFTLAGRADEELRTFLDQATRHLGVAFDCTLIALALSLGVMLLVHLVQRAEETLVIDCQGYCLEHLVNRVGEPATVPPRQPAPAVVAWSPDQATATPLEVEAGGPRLHFQGQDFPLPEYTFTLGRHPDCDLVFGAEFYPTVSPRHCEIIYDAPTYLLCDRSAVGTLLNEAPAEPTVPLRPATGSAWGRTVHCCASWASPPRWAWPTARDAGENNSPQRTRRARRKDRGIKQQTLLSFLCVLRVLCGEFSF